MNNLKRSCAKCRESKPGKLCWWCLAQSVAFPVEHAVWEHAPGLRWVTASLGLG